MESNKVPMERESNLSITLFKKYLQAAKAVVLIMMLLRFM